MRNITNGRQQPPIFYKIICILLKLSLTLLKKRFNNMKIHCEKFAIGRLGTVTSILLVAMLVYGAIAVWSAGMGAVIVTYTILLAIWVLLTMPRHLIIDDKSIVITHPIGQTVILKSEITEIRAIERSEIRGSLRLFGSGGFFGWFGVFRNSKFGTYRLYCGQLENLYHIKTLTKSYIISSSVPIEL